MNPIVVPIKSGSRDPYETTVWESGGTLRYECTCPEQSVSLDWCEHLDAVRKGESTMLAHPEDVGKLYDTYDEVWRW